MVKVLGPVTCIVNLKVGSSKPFWALLLPRMFLHCTPFSCMVFCKTLMTKRWLAFIRRTINFRMPIFLIFDVFRRTLKIPEENPDFQSSFSQQTKILFQIFWNLVDTGNFRLIRYCTNKCVTSFGKKRVTEKHGLI
mgnify:CR=1 FL=1